MAKKKSRKTEKKENVLSLKWKFNDGSEMSLPLDEFLRKRRLEIDRMLNSDDPWLRELGRKEGKLLDKTLAEAASTAYRRRVETSTKGKKGAEKRWNKLEGKQEIARIIKILAREDEDPAQLWDSFYGSLDSEGFDPKPGPDTSLDKQYYVLDGVDPPRKHSFEAFRKQINRIRKKPK